MDSLTGVRFLTALHVFVFHVWSGHGLPAPLARIEQTGVSAVAFFFVLSGFVPASTCGPRGRLELESEPM